jgi:glycosyltransferase involved in cell wall biosynthesis
VHVIAHGLNLAGHGARGTQPREVRTIGFLARVCADKGLHNLIAAAEQLFEDPEVPPFRVKTAGYLGKLDRPYLEAIEQRTAGWKPGTFGYVGEVTRAEKIAFLQSLDMMTLPTVYRESKGISGLEALANAVPLVLPDHGAFPEMVQATGGGLLYSADDPRGLAAALKRLLLEPQLANELGMRGKAAIARQFTAEAMAEQTLDLYRRVSAAFRV